MRDGWSDDDKSVLNDARAAGVNSPLLFGFLPRLHHEELRQAIASHVAAQETLDAHGPAATPEAIEARKAVETHLEVARHRIQELLGHIIGGAKVFLGGGQEANGIELADKVQDSANSALERLFPQFSEADHANWGQVVNRARAGDVGALSQVGYPGDVTKHPVCRRVLDLIGAGKKGKDVREHFRSAPFGWPKDAIDGALFVMLVAGNLRATVNGQPAQAQTLPQNQVGVASFYVDVPPLNVQQRLDLKALFQKIGITTQNGKESEAAAQFLQKLLALAESAGGSAPRPAVPRYAGRACPANAQRQCPTAQDSRAEGRPHRQTCRVEEERRRHRQALACVGTVAGFSRLCHRPAGSGGLRQIHRRHYRQPHPAGRSRSRARADETAHHCPAHRARKAAGRPRRRLQGRR